MNINEFKEAFHASYTEEILYNFPSKYEKIEVTPFCLNPVDGQRLVYIGVPSKIQRIISSLENQGLLIKGNYNQLAYDRTTWYALPKFEQSVVQNQTVNCSDLNKTSFENEQPIPINYQLTKQLTNKDIKDIVEQSSTTPLPYEEIVQYLNQKTNKNFKHTSKVTQRHIRARLAEGFTVSDFKQVIDKKCSDWLRDQKMKEYLRPETLFGTKFESYLNSKTTTTKQTGPYIDSCGLKVL